jgi:hypothetical protein
MPRASAEAKSAAIWRAGAKHPKPPTHLSRDARKLWREIVECRPVDYFRPGSLQLLEQFCEVAIAQRANLRLLATNPTDPAAIKATKDLAAVLTATALKLRISIQAEVDRKSGKLNEKEVSTQAASGVTRWLSGEISPGVKAN